MYHCGESYTGEKTADGKRMHNRGTLRLSSGNEYTGDFNDGRFDGEGIIHFTQEQGGGQYKASWKDGIAQQGECVFRDGLSFATSQWQYCTQEDRRLWSEHLTFVAPALPDRGDPADTIVPPYEDAD